jgi:hypothetical protein
VQFSLGIDVFLKGLGITHIPAVARDGRNLQAAGGARAVRSVKMTDGVKSQHLGFEGSSFAAFMALDFSKTDGNNLVESRGAG